MRDGQDRDELLPWGLAAALPVASAVLVLAGLFVLFDWHEATDAESVSYVIVLAPAAGILAAVGHLLGRVITRRSWYAQPLWRSAATSALVGVVGAVGAIPLDHQLGIEASAAWAFAAPAILTVLLSRLNVRVD